MKRRWIKKLAMTMALCLILNSGVLELTGEVYAAAKESALTGEVSSPESSSANVISSAAEKTTANTTTEESTTEKTSIEESTTEKTTTEESTTEKTTTEETTTEELSTEVSTAEGSTTEEATTEEFTTEEMTTEAALDEALPENAIALYALSEATIPDTVDEYLATYADKTEITALTVQDLVNLQKLCESPKVNGFQGKTIIFGGSGTHKTAGFAFSGIGTKDHPFQGTFKAYYGIDGSAEGSTLLEMHCPLFAYLGDGAVVHQLSIRADGCNSPIAEHITGNVTIKDIRITGNTGNGSAPSGTLAGTIEENAAVTVNNLIYESGKITGTKAGAIAGVIKNGATVTLDNTVSFGKQGSLLNIEGKEAAGAFYGAMEGKHTVDITWMNQIYTDVWGDNSANGQITGLLSGSSTELTLTGANEIKANVTNGKISGGIVGRLEGGASIVFPAGQFKITGIIRGNVWQGTAGGIAGSLSSDANLFLPEEGIMIQAEIKADNGIAGGAFGIVRNGNNQPVTIKNITTDTSTNISAKTAGGIVGKMDSVSAQLENLSVQGRISGGYEALGGMAGEIYNSKVLIKEPDVKATLANGKTGGIIGSLKNGSAVELAGSISGAQNFENRDNAGFIAYTMENTCLLYLNGIEGKIAGVSQLNNVSSMDEVKGVNFGCVFRNQTGSSSTGTLIGDGTLENVGKLYHSVGTDLGEGGEKDAAADLTSFAIVNFTNGVFGSEVFGNASLPDILSRTYTLHSNVDISYDKTGILSLNRNEPSAPTFNGSIIGKSGGVTITQNQNRHKQYTGVFSYLGGGNNTFENITVTGSVPYSHNVGGLAYASKGNGLTLRNFSMEKKFSDLEGEAGGVLAKEESGNEFLVTADNLTLASVIDAGTFCNYSGFITNMDNAAVDMKNIKLGGSLTTTGTGDTGGFLGKIWNRTRGTITGISVLGNTSYATNGPFGGLFHTVTNKENGSRLTLKDIKLNNLSVKTNGCGDCGLLLRDGKQLVLEVIDYDASGAVITGAALDFDEIAGVTDIRGNNTYGVISIHNTAQKFNGADGYHYENKATYTTAPPTGNPNTRYYYDVFQHLDNADGTPKVKIENGLIDSPEKYFLWDIVQCSDAPQYRVAGAFSAYFTNELPGNSATYTISGRLDLAPFSVYPAPRQNTVTFLGANNAELVFAADGMQNWTLPNIDKNGTNYQHYRLHCGFMGSTYASTITVDNITFSGTIGALPAKECGVLIAGSLNGNGKFTNITLNNLRIAGYGTDSSKEGASLLIGQIPSSTDANAAVKTVEFGEFSETGQGKDGVKMINYPSGTYAGASLIYKAGNVNGTNLVLRFYNMALDHDKAAGVLKYSSFLYDYHYTNNAAINKSSGLYLFKEADAKATPRNVTYGAELDDTTEYYDNSNKVFQTGYKPEEHYIPYVYHSDEQEKEIEVNPKSGDILKGCGTYEDPYVIETPKQFLTLYRYINEPKNNNGSYQYESFYKNWKMIKTGDDAPDHFCSSKHRVELTSVSSGNTSENGGFYFTGNGHADARVFGQPGFPTPDQLAQAYYQLGADIDLSGITKGTYGAIAEEFMGFGTLQRPFVGVWYGKDEAGNVHIITLPDKKKSVTYERYGLIQYAKGAVVKDMIITARQTFETDSLYGVTKLDTHGVYGTVFAYILGGDNIIDGVQVKMKIQSGECSVIGGYAGIVKKGGLILRNVGQTSFTDFKIDSASQKAMYGAVAGKVEDGYVIAESGEIINGAKEVVEKSYSGIIAGKELETIPNYMIVNGALLKTDVSTNDTIQIQVTDSGTEHDVTITIPHAAGLLVMAMAMNADALNVCPSDYRNHNDNRQWGYSENARCRKALYSDIGKVSDQNGDYKKAVRYDNMTGYTDGTYSADCTYAYPYLYDYMGIKGDQYSRVTVKTDSRKAYSVLNPGEGIGGHFYHIYWNLIENGTYDLKPYKEAFQGIGALYDNGDQYGASFRGSFDGKNSSISYKIIRKLYRDYKNNSSFADKQKRAGLFTVLSAPRTDQSQKGIYNEIRDFGYPSVADRACYVIQNIKINGAVDVWAADTNGNWITTAEGIRAADINFGQIAGVIEAGNYAFSNITSDVAEIKEDNNLMDNVGGLIGKTNQNTHIMFADCSLSGTQANPLKIEGNGFTGGLIGLSEAAICKIMKCSAEYVNVVSKNQNAGGLVGYTKEPNGKLFLMGKTTVKNSEVSGFYNAGAFVGESRCQFYADTLIGTKNTILSNKSMGGVIGELASNKDSKICNCIITDLAAGKTNDTVNVHEISCAHIGGIVGYSNHNLSIQEVSVTGTKTGDQYTSCLSHTANVNNKDVAIGGIIGKKENKATLQNCVVDTIKMYGKTSNYSVFIGGICGLNAADLYMPQANTVKVTNCHIQSDCESGYAGSGGLIGRVDTGSVKGSEHNTPYYAEGIEVLQNTVSGKNAGGLIGRADNDQNQETLCFSHITVKDGTVTGLDNAGGIVGYMETCRVELNDPKTAQTTVNQNMVQKMKITAKCAGGAFGCVKLKNQPVLCENISLTDCQIVGTGNTSNDKCSAGGFIGEFCAAVWDGNSLSLYNSRLTASEVVCELQGDSIKQSELQNYAAGGVTGRISGWNRGEILCDNLVLETDNKIGLKKTGDTSAGAIKLLKTPENPNNWESTWVLSNVILPKSFALGNGSAQEADAPKKYQAAEKLMQDYGYCVGTVVGMFETNSQNIQFYMMCSNDPEKEYTIPVMTYNPPVTDVGVKEAAQLAGGSNDYRKNAHIIYGAPVTEKTIDGVTYRAGDAFKNVAYMKKSVVKATEKYDTSTATIEDILKTYRFSKSAIDLFENAYVESYTYPGTSHTIGPALIYRAGTVDIQTMIETMADIMTNVAGVSATDLNNTRLEVKAVQKLVSGDTVTVGGGGTITDSTNQDPSIAVSYNGNGQWNYSMKHEDGLVMDSENNSAMSYTELTFTYKLDEGTHKKVFKLPVFVEEPLYYGVNMKILEGSAVSVSDVREKGILGTVQGTKVVIANDSSYTLLMEYAYGKTREKMPESVVTEKKFSLKPGTEGNNKIIQKGTKLRLIDVTHGNMPYYYEVTQDNITEVRFSDFKDSTGKPYQNQPIKFLKSEGIPSKNDPNVYEYTDLDGCILSNAGIERYLLTVYNADTTEVAYQIHTDMIPQVKKGDSYEDASASEKTQFMPYKNHENMPFFKVDAILPLKITLKKENGLTDITGKISRDSTVNVRATYEIAASSQYWALRKQGNSLDSKNNDKYIELAFYLRDKTRVSLPEGTIVSYRTNPITEETAVYSDGKVIKDGSILYSYKDIIGKENALNDLLALGQNSSHTVEFKLSFANADLSSLDSKQYVGWIELLRTPDSRYPMGSGNILDTFSKTISAESVKSIGFALKADKTEQLAVNTYPAPAESNSIEYKTLFDFSDVLKKISGAGKEEALNKWAGFDYQVTYSLMKKQKNADGTFSYTEYNGNDIVITAQDPADASVEHISQNGKLAMTYHFTAAEIDQNGANGLIQRAGSLSVHTADLVSQQENLTNYKLIAELTICEPGVANTEDVSKTRDFFVFTITKLKNDLSQ